MLILKRSLRLLDLARLYQTEKHGELSWLMFLASELSIKLKSRDLDGLFTLNCPVTALHACHLNSLGLIDKRINRSVWNESLNSDGLASEMWLYSYEATLKGWTGVATEKFIKNHSGFGPLFEKKISFFDVGAHIGDLGASSKFDILMSRKVKFASAVDAIDFDELIDFEPEGYDDDEFDEYA